MQKTAWKPAFGVPIINFGEHRHSGRGLEDKIARLPWQTKHLKALFSLPIYTGNGGALQRLKPGAKVFQDRVYWVPSIMAYHGFAREEACGFKIADVVFEGEVPHFNMRANLLRGSEEGKEGSEKNGFRKRLIPIHGELLRLGIKQYVDAMVAEGHTALFPELYIDGERTQGGRKFYAKVFRYIQDAVNAVEPLPTLPNGKLADMHSFRTAVGSYLEDNRVRQSTSKRLLGHSRRTVQEVSYNSRLEAIGEDLYLVELVEVLTHELPNVTAHLQPVPVRTLPLFRRTTVGSAPGGASSRKQTDRVARVRSTGKLSY